MIRKLKLQKARESLDRAYRQLDHTKGQVVHGLLKWLIESSNSEVIAKLAENDITCHKKRICSSHRRCGWKKSGWHVWHECGMFHSCKDQLSCSMKK